MRLIKSYFPRLSEKQMNQYAQLFDLYEEKNQQVNVISRKDIQHLYVHHVLHSLSIAKKFDFKSKYKILDLGTGGGFPGIPLAIYYPNCQFTLIDGTKKKIKVVQEIVDAIGLTNVRAFAERAEYHKGKYDMVISRAVASLQKLWNWSIPLLHYHENLGLVCLKGGDIQGEIKELPRGLVTDIVFINSIFDERYFDEKFIVHVHKRKRK